MSDIQATIEQAFERNAEITPRTTPTHLKDAVYEAIDLLDSGRWIEHSIFRDPLLEIGSFDGLTANSSFGSLARIAAAHPRPQVTPPENLVNLLATAL